MNFSNVLIIYKQNHPEARALASHIEAWLQELSLACSTSEAGETYDLPKEHGLVIALGGDGTILGIARKLAGCSTPILGINFGRVGYLTTVDAIDWRNGLELALAGKLRERACLMLRWALLRNRERIARGIAANDVVVSRGCLARLTDIHIKINGTSMGNLRSDGVIITSPLGSAGYSVSAGGPVLHPELEAIGLTPICPFTPAVAPLVLPGTTCFDLAALESSGDCYLTIDGQEGQEILKNDVVEVSGWPKAVRFLGDDACFYSRLGNRAFCLPNSAN